MAPDGNTLTFDPQADRTRVDALVRSIRAALTETGRALPTDENAIAAARAILAERGDLEHAIEASGWGIKQGAAPYHVLLLVYRAAMAEIDDPTRWVARLRRDEATLRLDADYYLRHWAEFAGKAEYRRQRGETELAAQYASRADADLTLSNDKLAEAEAKGAEADRIAARVRRTADMFEIATGSRAQVERAVS